MRTEALNAAGFTAPQQDAVAGMEPKHLGAPTQTYDALALLVINKTTSAVKVAGAAADPNTPKHTQHCLLYTSPSPRDRQKSRMPSSA